LFQAGKIKELPQYAVVTNGTIMTNSIIDVFNKHHVNMTISLDGPKEVNDKQRVYQKSHESVYDKVISTIDLINQKREFNLSIEVTMSQHFIDLTESEQNRFLDFLASKRIDSTHVVPVISQVAGLNITDEGKLKESIDLITDYSLNTIMSNNPFYMVKVADFLGFIVSKELKENYCSAGITNFAIDSQGDIYGCFMLINPGKNLCMGNVNDDSMDVVAFDHIASEFKMATYASCEECSDCFLRGFCSNCVAASYAEHGVLNKPIRNTCIAQKAIFERLGLHVANNNLHKKA
jgi:uncharacterized protein